MSQLFCFLFYLRRTYSPNTKGGRRRAQWFRIAYFSSDEVPDMLSLRTGSTLPPKHPTKPKRTFLWTTGTTLLSVITVQGLMHCLSLGFTHQPERRGPFSQLSLTPLICILGEEGWHLQHVSWCRGLLEGLLEEVWAAHSSHRAQGDILPRSLPPCAAAGPQPSPNILPRRGRPPFDFVLFNLREPGL